MAHHVDRSFGRATAPRLALFRGLVTNLIKFERIRTTVAKVGLGGKAWITLFSRSVVGKRSATFCGKIRNTGQGRRSDR
jgi:hypothetical protein